MEPETRVTAQRIHELRDDPERLEALYRQSPGEFREALAEAFHDDPDSTVMRIWRARLEYREPGPATAWRRTLWWAVAIALAVGALVRLPAIWLSEDWYYPRFAPSLVILALAAYFWREHRSRRLLIGGTVLAVVAAAYAALLPGLTDSVVMALIHLPLVFWVLLGLVFTGDAWRDTDARIRFVRYNGELVVLASLVGLGGMVFSGLTMGLFEMIADNIEELYMENVGLVGATAVPLAGTYLYDTVFNRRTGIAAVLARVFAPLFLVMTVTYLVVAFAGGQSPFTDRSFLITFNGLLLVVLGISVFSIVERAGQSEVVLTDYVNLALVVVTLVIDAVALSAILFRLASYGFTPNRVTVLGANLVIIGHLAWMCWTYLGVVRRRATVVDLRRAVTRYLPVYGVWAAIVVLILPPLFRFS